MANIQIFGSSNIPAFAREVIESPLDVLKLSVGFPILSIKGRTFTFKDGDDKRIITKPGSDEPAGNLEVVILDIGPSADMKLNSRVFYLQKYVEGSNAKPDCLSEDGVSPHADSVAPQSKTCALCPHNVKGSGDTGKGKACRSSKRLAVATPDALDNPMLLRVPGDSLKALDEYLKGLKASGVTHPAYAITKLGFDYTVSHPALTFKPMGWASNDPREAIKAEQVQFITGKKELPSVPKLTSDVFSEEPAPAFVDAEPEVAPKAAPKKEKPAPAPKVEEEDDLPTTPKVKTEVKVEAAAPKVETVVATDSAMDAALDDLDFDD